MVLADRNAGYPSRSAIRTATLHSYPLVREREFDRVIEREGVPWDEWNWFCLIDLLWRGDIWIAFFECLFFSPDERFKNRVAFGLIRSAGIRIVVLPHGGDIDHRHRYRDRFDVMGRLQKDYPDWDLVSSSRTATERIRLFCEQAELVLAGDNGLRRLLPRTDLLFKYFPVDCAELKTSPYKGRPIPSIWHAPNHRLTKGTDYLLSAVKSLQLKGIRCELYLIERVPRDDALRLYQEADIIADQFCNGSFGSFALEGMAFGKPVLTYLDQEHLGDPVFNLPLVNANPENLEQVLGVLLQVPELRERIGKASRESVEKYQSIEALAEVWDRIYRHVWWREPLNLESTRHFDPARGTRSFTEDPARPDFWPVPVDDLLPEIHEALARASFPALNVARTVSA